MTARVYVTLRKEVLDPQGKAVKSALRSLGFAEVEDVRVGKYLEVTINGEGGEAEAQVRRMCEKLLANPVIENFRFELTEG